MGSKTVSIPAGMVFRKFYCHKCGQKLQRAARTFTVRPGDPDYKKYAIHKNGLRITFFPGDVQVTEYDFCCPDCHHVTGYREQQIKQCELQRSILERVREAVAAQLPQKTRLYTTLCLCTAAGLLILLW